jgi:hypothetical protein
MRTQLVAVGVSVLGAARIGLVSSRAQSRFAVDVFECQ